MTTDRLPAMDRPRAGGRRHWIRRAAILAFLACMVVLAWSLKERFTAGPPVLEREALLVAEVKRGDLPRRVRGYGILVPVEMRMVTAEVPGRVEKIHLEPGAVVKPGTLILELSNRELEQGLLEAQWQVRAAEAELEDLKAQWESRLWEQQARVAAAEADYLEEQMAAERARELAPQGLIPSVDLRRSETRARALRTRYEVEVQRLKALEESRRSQVAVQQAKLQQARARYELWEHQAQALHVTSQIGGVLQKLEVEEGQSVAAGAPLAAVAPPWPLKAEVRIPDVRVKDVRLGLPVRIDLRTSIAEGTVARIDPAVQDGMVLVDVALEGPPPDGARPDLSVDAEIVVETLRDVLFLPRPAFEASEGEAVMFRLTEDQRCARRSTVLFGPVLGDAIVVRRGLREGDRVILSDLSQWREHELICFAE